MGAACGDVKGGLLTDADLRTERATKPPTRWRNKWRWVGPRFENWMTGDECLDARWWPSRDVAESAAARELATSSRLHVKLWRYVGAHPETPEET